MPKSKEYVTSSDSDSEVDAPKAKKKKSSPEKKKKSEGSSSSSGTVTGLNDETMYPLAKMRFVSATKFHGKKMVNIREYYNDAAGDLKPGRKGIALSLEQWEKLKELEGTIDEALADL